MQNMSSAAVVTGTLRVNSYAIVCPHVRGANLQLYILRDILYSWINYANGEVWQVL